MTGTLPVGDRWADPGSGVVMEWTFFDAWAPVCPTDDVAMADFNDGYLCRRACGARWVDGQVTS